MAIIAGALLTTAVLNFHSNYREPIQVGDTFPKIETRDIDGKNVSWPSQSFFVLYMRHDMEMGLQLETYTQVQQQKQDRTLPVVSIVAGTEKEVHEIAHTLNSTTTIVRDNGGWRSRLGLGKAQFRLLLVDGTSHIKFATDYATPDDLRQLNEKALTGRVEYPVNLPRLLQKGDRFSGFLVVDMRSNSEVAFTAETATSVICFTSHCPACDLEEEIRNYAFSEIHRSQHTSTKLLFSNRFSRVDLLRTLDRYGIHAQVLQAAQNIPGLEDPLSFETYAPAEIAQIDLDAGGIVKRIAYWTNGAKKIG